MNLLGLIIVGEVILNVFVQRLILVINKCLVIGAKSHVKILILDRNFTVSYISSEK